MHTSHQPGIYSFHHQTGIFMKTEILEIECKKCHHLWKVPCKEQDGQTIIYDEYALKCQNCGEWN